MDKNVFLFNCPSCGRKIRRETNKSTLTIGYYNEEGGQSDFKMGVNCCHSFNGTNCSMEKHYRYRLKLILNRPNKPQKTLYVENLKILGSSVRLKDGSTYSIPNNLFFWGLNTLQHLDEVPLLKLIEEDYFAKIIVELLKRYDECGLRLQEGINKVDVYYEKWYTYCESSEYVYDDFKDTVLEDPGFTEIEESVFVKTINYQIKEVVEWDDKTK